VGADLSIHAEDVQLNVAKFRRRRRWSEEQRGEQRS
jgi:hypothetical protein